MEDITLAVTGGGRGRVRDQALRDDFSHFAARRAAKHASAVVASMQDGLMVVDESGRICDVNAVLCSMTGFARGALIGQRRYPFWTRSENAVNGAALAHALGSDDPSATIRMTRRDGSAFTARFTLAPITGSEGTETGYVASVRMLDATDATPTMPAAPATSALSGAARTLIADAVSRNEPSDATLQRVARGIAQMIGADVCHIARSTGEELAVISSWTAPNFAAPLGGTAIPGDLVTAIAAGVSWRHDGDDDPSAGRQTILATPILGGSDTVWGSVIVLTGAQSGALPADAGESLRTVLSATEIGIIGIAARSQFEATATQDTATQLPNRKGFTAHLDREVRRAARSGHDLSVIVMDIDQLRRINAAVGPEAGDRVIAAVAGTLQKVARGGDIVARIGGDSFGWILPETEAHAALLAADRARAAVALLTLPGCPRIAISAGASDIRQAGDSSHDLVRQAAHHLREAKLNGRDRCVGPAGDAAAASNTDRSRARGRTGLRLLASAIDARCGHASSRSASGAELARRVARELGWSPRRAALLSDAALLRDIGKIVIGEETLRRSGLTSPEERAEIARHVTTGAQMASGILSGEQAEWIACHHHRYDGMGNPDTRRGVGIPEGARVIAAVDAWLDMVEGPRAPGNSHGDRLLAFADEAGGALCPRAVDGVAAVVRQARATRVAGARDARHRMSGQQGRQTSNLTEAIEVTA